jgi:hypothetical protein
MQRIKMNAQTKERRLKKCQHFNGIINDTCRVGVAYLTVRDSSSSPYRFPCLPDGADIPCQHRVYPTLAELEAEDKERALMVANVMLVRKQITNQTQGKRRVRGYIICPVCKEGRVNYGVAYNGHIHAQCTTESCVSWIE